MSWFRILLGRFVVIVSALAMMQLPLFMQAYTHQLLGHVHEVELQVGAMRRLAASSGKSLEQYILKFMENADEDFAGQGVSMERTRVRAIKLARALESLLSSSFWTRPFIFIRDLDWEICTSTAHAFQPAVSLTFEGLTYALAGTLLGYFLRDLFRIRRRQRVV